MAFFSYTGRDNQGKSTSGVLEGLTEDSVAKQLLQTGIVPLEITSFVEKKDPFNTLFRNLGKKLPTLQDLSLFSRQMYSLTRSGVPIIHSIEVVAESTQNLLLQSTLKTIVIDVQGGQSLSIAMRKHPDIFPNLMTALVNVGENSGSLDIIFKQISVYFEKEGETRKL
ncbi:MAG: biosis protein MshG, partial [Francisellaceae bacterium]|nr:biosis protein MshG [Francisellaceae bacterium]